MISQWWRFVCEISLFLVEKKGVSCNILRKERGCSFGLVDIFRQLLIGIAILIAFVGGETVEHQRRLMRFPAPDNRPQQQIRQLYTTSAPHTLPRTRTSALTTVHFLSGSLMSSNLSLSSALTLSLISLSFQLCSRLNNLSASGSDPMCANWNFTAVRTSTRLFQVTTYR